MLLGATLAGQAFANAPVAAVHALAYPIGGIFHVPHGLSNALMLTHVMRFNAGACSRLYAELAETLLPNSSGSDEAKTEALTDHMETLIIASKIPRTLREVGIVEADIPRLVSDAMKQTRLLVNNPRELNEMNISEIYRAAL
jgi:alcohol dehydrogenase